MIPTLELDTTPYVDFVFCPYGIVQRYSLLYLKKSVLGSERKEEWELF